MWKKVVSVLMVIIIALGLSVSMFGINIGSIEIPNAKDNVKLAALATAVASLTTYLLTEDMQGKMVAADKWTALMLLYFVAEMGILYYTEKQRDPTKEQ